MTLFTTGNFKLHSGDISSWKIDCDFLTDEDLATLAQLVAPHYGFEFVEGVPTGGLRFAKALERYIVPGCGFGLIVDDVLSTGSSMEEQRGDRNNVNGIVIFSRTENIPTWITPIFTLDWSHV